MPLLQKTLRLSSKDYNMYILRVVSAILKEQLSPSEMEVLAYVMGRGFTITPALRKEICSALNITKGNLCSYIKRMKAKGYLIINTDRHPTVMLPLHIDQRQQQILFTFSNIDDE